jgi:hypothetical protein
MSKMDKWPTRAQNPGAAWLSLAATGFASTTLFKLAPRHASAEKRDPGNQPLSIVKQRVVG